MTNTTAHANCSHPATKQARAACRREARTKRIAAARADVALTAAPGQLDKVNELLELGAVIRVRGPIFRVVSASGNTTYITHTAGHCNCPYGLRRSRAVAPTLRSGQRGAEVCYHVLAARIKEAHYVR